MITIIDYNTCNVGSISNMLKKLGCDSIITKDPEVINKASKIILPGVGAFDKGMENLETLGIVPIIKNRVLKDGIPILGICLGMQLITNSSEEGNKQGLCLIDATTKKFNFSTNALRVPHMGWNRPSSIKQDTLFNGLSDDARFYFVHSYYVDCINQEDVSMLCNYGIEFSCAIERENIFGVQFHPEKSHKYGMNVLQNFIKV
jgi:glutamine amidotransferase